MTLKQHIGILLIKAGLRRKDIAVLMNTHRSTVTMNISGYRTLGWFREKLFKLLRERIPEEVQEYTDVWIDEKADFATAAKATTAEKDAA